MKQDPTKIRNIAIMPMMSSMKQLEVFSSAHFEVNSNSPLANRACSFQLHEERI
jgi:hypothetical protein